MRGFPKCPECGKDWNVCLDPNGTRGCGNCGCIFKDGKVIENARKKVE